MKFRGIYVDPRLLLLGVFALMALVAPEAMAQYTPQDFSADINNARDEVIEQIGDVATPFLTVIGIGTGLAIVGHWVKKFRSA